MVVDMVVDINHLTSSRMEVNLEATSPLTNNLSLNNILWQELACRVATLSTGVANSTQVSSGEMT